MDFGRDLEALSASTSDMVGQQFKLARLELVQDLRKVVNRAGLVLAIVPFAVGAFILLTQAAIGLLSRSWPREVVLATLGAFYLSIAILAAVLAMRSRTPAPSAAGKVTR